MPSALMNASPFYLVVVGEIVSVHPTLEDAKRIAAALFEHDCELQIRSHDALWQFDRHKGEWRQLEGCIIYAARSAR